MRPHETETSHPDSYDPPETDPGPPPVTAEELRELVDYIQLLWTARSDAIRDKSEHMLLGASKELLRAYEELAKLGSFLHDENAIRHYMSEYPETLAAARDELAFVPMVGRILKLRNNQ